MKKAEKENLKAINGLDMLIYQAKKGFQQWFKKTPTYTPELKKLIENSLKRQNLTTKIGITGSIGMGKTTVSSMFKKNGIEVWNADLEVHKLYENGNKGYKKIYVSKIPNKGPGLAINDRLKRASQ